MFISSDLESLLQTILWMPQHTAASSWHDGSGGTWRAAEALDQKNQSWDYGYGHLHLHKNIQTSHMISPFFVYRSYTAPSLVISKLPRLVSLVRRPTVIHPPRASTSFFFDFDDFQQFIKFHSDQLWWEFEATTCNSRRVSRRDEGSCRPAKPPMGAQNSGNSIGFTWQKPSSCSNWQSIVIIFNFQVINIQSIFSQYVNNQSISIKWHDIWLMYIILNKSW